MLHDDLHGWRDGLPPHARDTRLLAADGMFAL
jgi:hypothetical protein